MIDVRYPAPSFRVRKQRGLYYLFDAIRRRWVLLTEEEWVRQNFISCLIETNGYPAAVMAVEKEIELNGLKKRFDLLIYNQAHQPWMLVECKAPAVELNEAVLQQALRYNLSVPVRYILITNGSTTMGWEKTAEGLKPLSALPAWKQP